MKKNVTKCCATLALATMLVSCGASKKAQNSQMKEENMVVSGENELYDDGYLVLTDMQRGIVAKNNEFALKMFHELSGLENNVFSPLSVSYLMGMLANGADGITRREIMDVLGCKDVSLGELNEFYKLMLQKSGRMDKSVSFNIANYIAVNKQNVLKPMFVKEMEDGYRAGVERLDFKSPSTLKRINGWCSKQTDGMIPAIIGQVEPSAVSYIMNAIYFNGTWSDKFDKNDTKLENFRGYTRDIKKAQMMHRNDKYMYYGDDTFSAVRVPYGNGTYAMTVLLPVNGKSVGEVMNEIGAEGLAQLRGKMDNCIVDLKLPCFTVSCEQVLNRIIAKLGASSMFANTANFSNFSDGNLFVSKILQKAKIEVSEEGTKAAAVTAAIMTMSAWHPEEPRRVKFYADHPFAYVITESSTGAILFMGQYTGSDI